ncbi:hypothetical protein GCM10009733_002860 [Nonomuraea maheshkhaliensis]|uniref:DUF397 domain-containing protein n=2 Tax=Nonomuraea TaxID=83681 RepID=A0ABP4QIR1_9ACTN
MADPRMRHLTWLKSKKCNPGDCVEVAFMGSYVFLRNSKEQAGPVLAFTRPEWDAFVEGIHAGDFA